MEKLKMVGSTYYTTHFIGRKKYMFGKGKEKKDEKNQLLYRALQAGALYDLAIRSGGTGDSRKPLSEKERKRRKKKRQMAKASRKANR